MTYKKYLILLAILPLSLSACSSARDQLGLNRTAPDEFAVLKRAPLAIPPNSSLPKPRLGAPRPQEQRTDVQARISVLGAQPASAPLNSPLTSHRPSSSSSEMSLLKQAGTFNSDPDIRQKIDSEIKELNQNERSVADKLLGLGGFANAPSGRIVDATRESARIRKNLSEGKSVTEGETPFVKE